MDRNDFPDGSAIKKPPAEQETWVQSLDWEDPLEEEIATTPIFLPGEFRGQRSLAGYDPWSLKESDTIGRLSTAQHVSRMLDYIICYLYIHSFIYRCI